MKYKPRIVQFGSLQIDTRMGACEYYPGDEIISCTNEHCIILGMSTDHRPWKKGLIIQCADGSLAFFYNGKDYPSPKLIKRHGQHLIDLGEMIQCTSKY